MCAAISARTSASMPPLRNTPRARAARPRMRRSGRRSMLGEPEQRVHALHDLEPVALLVGELPAPGRGQPIVLGSSVVLGGLPLRRNPIGLLDAAEGGVERALLDAQHL